jgi:argininosuccinate lyase
MDNAMDAVSARDFLVESTAALATLATTLSGLAEDIVIYANKGYIEVDDAYASTSSIMPQKKNPDTLELVRARSGDAAAGLNGLLTTLKGLPRAYNRDLQRAGGHAWRAIDGVSEATEVAAGAIATADWNDEALADAAGEGFSTATGVADALAMAGVPFRTAHEVVASAAQAAGDDADFEALDVAARETLGESLTAFVDRGTIESALDPAMSVTSRDSAGGPAPDAVEKQIVTARDDHAADSDMLAEHRTALQDAAEQLRAEGQIDG